MKIVITCAGSETRWNNHMGVAKQMVPMFGVPLLQRTIQAMNRVFPDSDLYVSVQDQSKKGSYVVDGKYAFYVLTQFNEGDSALKSLVPFFKGFDDDFLVLMGDVSFSNKCISRIHNIVKRERSQESNEVKIFGRKYGSKISSHEWAEIFAFYVTHEAKTKLFEAIEIVDKYYNLKLIDRKIGWDIMSCYYSKSKDLSEIKDLCERKNFPPSSFITIDDETDDFDYPYEYEDYTNEISKRTYWRVTLKSLRRWVKTQRSNVLYKLGFVRSRIRFISHG